MGKHICQVCLFLMMSMCILSGCADAKNSVKLSDVQSMQIFVPSKLGTFYDINDRYAEETILGWVKEANITTFNVPKGAKPDLNSWMYFEEPFGTTTLTIMTKADRISYSPTFYLYLYPKGEYKMKLASDVITVVVQPIGKYNIDTYHLQSKTLFNWLMNKKEWISVTN